MSRVKIDNLNLAIIKELRQGRKSFKRIADRLEVTENTVRSRVNKMMDTGLLDINGQVDIEQIPHHQLVIIGVKLKTTDMFKKGEEFSRVKGVVSVSVVTGRYDLILLVIFNEEYGLQEFYAQEVSRIEDVQSLETFVVYKGYNLKVPYIV
ncbi:Lrp/AsnC family transcriptional regulator [Desulfovermiculus halophilus]|jgi:Lrp/AsnC family transcriptional regulator for asnA, asnC and gidA|uniref:Lrp/AsnC family transcriptional regulator n=1 Tax=Desulfovermiculus halophilus TaxID=339722 RepID=UPI000487C6FB|nr:Lrp/AsnC family transcriptional regulator [Desulfovermiculus halophilus]